MSPCKELLRVSNASLSPYGEHHEVVFHTVPWPSCSCPRSQGTCSVAVLPPPSAESPVPHSQPHAPEDWCHPVSAIENSGRDGSIVEHQQELVTLDIESVIVIGESLPSSPLFPFLFSLTLLSPILSSLPTSSH